MKRTTLAVLFIWVLLFAACNKNTVQVSSFSPSGEVEELTTFEITFSKDLAPEEKMHEWVTEEYVTFDPPVMGKFKWVSPNQLLFSPEVPLKPGTEYKAKVTDKVLFGQKFSSDFEDQVFHTAYFDATDVEFFWTHVPRSDYKVTARLNLNFNYDVDPATLGEYLEIEANGKKITDYKIITTEPAPIIAIDLGEQKQKEKEQEFKVRVRSGLTSPLTENPMSDTRDFSFTLPPLTRLAITSVTSGFSGNNKGWIQVHTTQQVDEKSLSKYVSLDPRSSVNFSTSDNSFRIEGRFSPGSTIDLKIARGLPGLYGGTLEHEYEQTMILADLSPTLEFADKEGKYLLRSGLKNLQVNAVNVPEVEVEVHEVFANNLLFFLYNNGSGYYNDDYYGEYSDDYYYYETNNHRVNNFGKLLQKDTVNLGDLKNYQYNFTVGLDDHVKQRFKGVFVVKVRDFEDYWRRDSKIISVSDLGLMARKSRDELHVFVNELGSANALEGVDVMLISSNNQTLAKGKTDANGTVHFPDLRDKVEDFTPRLIVAVNGDDFNFIDLADTRIETSRYEVGGKQENSEVYDTYVYADRNLYRPGETANISGIIRTKDMKPVSDIPVLMKVITPRGRTFKTYNKKLNSEGSFEQAVKLPDALQTGEYVAEIYSGSKDLLGSYRFSVEEFVPDKIRVNLDADKTSLAGGDQMEVKVHGEYLFGAPAAEHAFEYDIRLTHATYSSKKYKEFRFSPNSVENTYIDNEFSSELLDEDGKAKFKYTLPNNIKAGGYLNGTAYVSVFDATGRTVNRSIGFRAYPKNYFLGIHSPRYYYAVNEPVQLGIAAVNGEDKDLSNFPVQTEVIRYEWRTVLTQSGGYYRYKSEKKEIVEKPKKSMKVSGKGTYSFTPDKSGHYQLRVYREGSKNYVMRDFYVYGWGGSTATSFEVDREGRIDMVFDKDKYEPGETAKVLFTTPFSGKMLVTFEQNRVLQHQYLTVENNSAELEISITDEHLPNFYVTATLFRPHEANSGTPFLVGHGFQSVSVEKESNKLKLEIDAPERIKPRTTQEIVIKSNPEENIHVTLAVVDEGILQIKNFKSPNPYAYMYAKRALRVQSFDLYEMLLPELKSMRSSPAGGDESGSGKRANPITAERFKLLSYWSGIRRTDSRGEVRLRVPIPQFNGEARIMAVAYKGPRFGSASQPMKISDDVVVMPAIPRVLSVTDSISLPVSLMNTTSKSGKVNVKLSVEGPLMITSGKTQSVSIKGKGTESVRFGVQAKNAAGKGKIVIEASGLDNVKQEIEIAVRPISPLIVDDGAGSISAGKTVEVKIPGGFVDGSQHTKLTVSKFPATKLSKHLKYLVGYPYGCLEQTTSKAFPQLYFEDLAAAVSPDEFTNGNPVYFVNEAITKIQSMLRNDGSLSYWPGGSYYNWWSTVYATHFLVEAKKAGYNVSQYTLDKTLAFLSRMAAAKETYNYTRYTSGGARKVEVKAKKEVIYSLYVMALAGEGDLSLCNYYRSHPHLLTTDSKYLLGGAFGLMNEWNAFHEIIPNAFTPARPARETGGSFDSEVRSNALILNVLLDVDPQNKQIPYLVKHLSNMDRQYYSTQDRCWAFLSLGKAARKNASANLTIDIMADGKKIGTYKDGNYVLEDDAMNNKKVTMKATGKGEVYYYWATEGIKASADFVVEEEDQYISARRAYYDRSGSKISGGTFTQGDLIVCKLTLTGGNQLAENVVISDLVPAGFEIENPRLSTSTGLNWIKNSLYPEYLDVKDDRLLVFTNAYRNSSKDYYYMLRVVTAGTFKLPALGAEAMYNPEFHSYHGARTIRVLPKTSAGI